MKDIDLADLMRGEAVRDEAGVASWGQTCGTFAC